MNNEKWFNKFTTEELFTEYIHSLMQQGKAFMVFPDNKQILIEEVDEWNKVNGVTDSTPRILYHHTTTPHGDGYVVHYTEDITSVLVPDDEINMDYEDFVARANADLTESVSK
jgi:3-methyladenine DNA glycosylase AlkD